jgi:hypothetical protein
MVLDVASILVGVVGFGWAGWKDLKTTEFPDWIPYSMILAALLLRGAFSFILGDYSILLRSAVVGALFMVFGLLLYYTKQWGDGGAWLLGAMGFLYPDGLGFAAGSLPFPLVMLFNFFFVAFFYIVAYSIAVGVKKRKTKKFFRSFRKDAGRVLATTAGFTLAVVGIFYYFGLSLQRFLFIFLFPPLLFLLLVFLHYGRFVEKTIFRKRVDVKDLKVGDVPVGEKWRVLSRKEIRSLRKRGGEIWIKEGVRFAPVFFLTLVAMLLFGNVVSVFVGFL